jgi:GNAT superfamily N-acetyltransferase
VPVQISPVRSRRDLARFIDVPWKLFDRKRFPAWVPPLRLTVKDALDTKNNPFYQNADRELFLATRDGQPVGRIAAIENRAHNRFHEDKVGFFGFFECADDQEAADALFAAAEAWLRARGLDTMRGPMNPSTNQECGLLIEGFDVHPVFMTNWNPAYFLPLLDRAGFVKAKDLYGYWYQASGPDKLTLPPRVAALARRAVTESGVTFRDIDIGRFDSEVDVLWDIYNSAWEKNWGFVPMTRAEFVHTAKDLKPLVDPRLAFVAEVGGKPAGVMVNLLDYAHAQVEIGNGRLFPFGFLKLLAARRKLKSGRMMVLGIKAEHRTRSILPLFIHELVRRAEAMDAVGGEASWILEDNLQMVRTMELVGAPLYRKWRIYDRPIR